MKRNVYILALLFALATGNNVFAYSFSAVAPSGQTLYYNISGNNVTVTYPGTSSSSPYSGYTRPVGDLVIPSSVTYVGTTYSVTSIGEWAFYYCGLISVTMPNSVTSIGQCAFYGCSGLTDVIIGNSVTSIGGHAFRECPGLTSVTIPNSVTSIGQHAFYACSALAKVRIGDGVTEIGDGTFYYCSGLKSVTLGMSVSSLGTNVFGWCNNVDTMYYNARSLTTNSDWYSSYSGYDGYGFKTMKIKNLIVGDSVLTIPAGAFYNQTDLTSVSIGNSVASIGQYAFYGCSGLTDVTIGNSVTSIGSYAFSGCTGLTSVTIPNSVTSMGQYAFSACSALTDVTIGNSVTSIGEWAFYNCGLTSVTIPNSVTSIGQSAFYGCSALAKVRIGDGVTEIGYEAFYYCSGLKSVTLGMSVSSLGTYVFIGCNDVDTMYYNARSLTTNSDWYSSYSGYNGYGFKTMKIKNLIVGDSVLAIPEGAFYNQTDLASVSIGNSVASIWQYAFYGCSGLTDVTIGNSVTSIGSYAFSGCTGLTSVTIPNSVTSIGQYAFSACSALTDVTIGNSVTSIGEWAFYNCGLTSVTIPNSVTSIGQSAFYGCSALAKVRIGDGVTEIGYEAFYYCSGLKSVTLGMSVSSLGTYVFIGCNDVDTMYYNARSLTTNSDWYSSYSGYDGYGFKTMKIKNLIVGDSVLTIPMGAFYNQTDLTSVSIGKSVTSIGSYAFYACGNVDTLYYNATNLSTNSNWYDSYSGNNSYGFRSMTNLQTLIIGDGVQTIPAGAFYRNQSLSTVTIPNSVTSIGDYAFGYCTGLSTINLGNNISYLGYGIFDGCNNLNYNNYGTAKYLGNNNNPYGYLMEAANKSISACVINTACYYIHCYAFQGCTSLLTVTIPNNIALIRIGAFSQCSSLVSVTIPNSVVKIESDVFANCSGLTTVNLGNSISSIQNGVFANCNNLSHVNYTGTISQWCNISFASSTAQPCNYSQDLFMNEELVTDVVIPEGISSVKPYAFLKCGSIEHVTIPISVDSIGEYAFDNCTGITDIVIPDSVTAIGEGAFRNCNSLTNVSIGRNLSSIGVSAFENCTSVKSLYYNARDCSMSSFSSSSASYGFRPMTSLEKVVIGNDVELLPNNVFYRMSSIKYLTIGRTVSVIGQQAFYNCSGLLGVYSENTNPPIVGVNAFSGVATTILIQIPCNTHSSYSLVWNMFSDFQECCSPFETKTESEEDLRGTTEVLSQATCSNDTAIIIAIPNYGYHFTQWADSVTSNPRSVNVTQDTMFVAQFGFDSFSYAVNSEDTLLGITTMSGVDYYLSNVTVEAVPNYGYHFVQWSDGSSDNPRTFVLTQDTNFTAQFAFNTYTTTATSAGSEMGSVTGGGAADYLSEITLEAQPNYGYHFTQWSDGGTMNPRTFVLTRDTTFAAQFDYNTYAVVVNSSDTVMGIASGTGSANYLTPMTIGATANYGYHFVQWSDGNSDNPRTFVLTQDMNLIAQFAFNTYTTTATSAGSEMGSVTGGGAADYLSEITLEAQPNYGYHFTQWSDGETMNPRTFALTRDTTFAAQFDYNTYAVVVNSSDTVMGIASGTGSANYLTPMTIGATANYGYHFVQWSDGSSDNPRTFVLTQDTNLIAQFAYNTYTTTATSVGSEMGSVTGGGAADYLSEVTLEAQPNHGYHFTQWSDGETMNPRTFVLTRDTTFAALFDYNTYTVVVNSSDTVMGIASGTGSANYLTPMTIGATANYGYHFVQWSDGSSDNPRTFVLTQDMNLIAQFTFNTYTITANTFDSSMGEVMGGGTYAYGTTIQLSVEAKPGYHFTCWDDGNTENPRNLLVTKDETLTALYSLGPYEIVASANNEEWGHVTGAGVYNYNDEITLTAVPHEGYRFLHWDNDVALNPYVFAATEGLNLVAVFAPATDVTEDELAEVEIYSFKKNIVVTNAEGCNIQIYTSSGQLLIDDVLADSNKKQYRMNVGGIYIVRVNNSKTQKVIIL